VRWLDPGKVAGFERDLVQKQSALLENVAFLREDDDKRLLGLTGRHIGGHQYSDTFVVMTADVTERRSLEVQVHQAQKMEAIGQLSAGIAHEINTPIQYVGDNLAFLSESWKSVTDLVEQHRSTIKTLRGTSLPEEQKNALEAAEHNADFDFLALEIPKAIRQALEGAQRVAKIVRAMKEFSHPGTSERAAVDINRAVETTVTVARNEWKYVAEVETNLDPNLRPAPCYAGELNQVILNLIVNAAHAIGDVVQSGQKGLITIQTVAKGDWAEIAVSDTGGGIPTEIRTRVFDPFFTTKEVGKGTGQGLALAHSVIVKKHGGKIWFETEVGRGTTFFIHLPMNSEFEPEG
jgi:signal transduction histidine kinase